jgi:hypothetical protein
MPNTLARLLLLSAAAGSSVTLASAPALAYDHLFWGYNFLDNTPYDVEGYPTGNFWDAECWIDWDNYIAVTKAACFLTQVLTKAQGYTEQDINNHFGMYDPTSAGWYESINDGAYFTKILDIEDVQAGDIIAFNKTATYTGHTVIVTAPAVEIVYQIRPMYVGTKQWKVSVMDSTSTAHGCTDTRWVGTCMPLTGTVNPGIGEGNMRFYTLTSTGALKGHTWSVTASNTSYHGEVTRPYAIGRLTGLLPPAPPPLKSASRAE